MFTNCVELHLQVVVQPPEECKQFQQILGSCYIAIERNTFTSVAKSAIMTQQMGNRLLESVLEMR